MIIRDVLVAWETDGVRADALRHAIASVNARVEPDHYMPPVHDGFHDGRTRCTPRGYVVRLVERALEASDRMGVYADLHVDEATALRLSSGFVVARAELMDAVRGVLGSVAIVPRDGAMYP